MMKLSAKLNDLPLIFGCPHCAREQTKNGSWFKSVSRFLCVGCGHEARITYEDKIRIFEKHVRLNRRKRA
jgi:transposase-like protein